MTEFPDRLLRDALTPGPPQAASDGCVDAEALAAWAEGAMSGAAREAFEIHAAGCARCQALMAAMARTEPPPEPAWWRRAHFSWLMPLAAAAAAIVVVVSLSIGKRGVPAPQTARLEPVPVPLSRAEDRVASGAAAPSSPAPEAPRAAVPAKPAARRDKVTDVAETFRRKEEPKAAADAAAKAESRAQAADAPAAPPPIAAPQPSTQLVTAAPPPAAAPPPPLASATPTTGLTAAARERAAPAPAAAAAAAGAAANVDASPLTRNTANDAQTMKRAIAPAPLLIASPVRESQWRIVNGGVEHTEDAGVTWRPQALGVDLPVRAGVAPAARVCWLVGARGLVLLTTDGARWQRITFPEPVDLIAIEAADASHATVTTAAGQRFRTVDGGRIWSREGL